MTLLRDKELSVLIFVDLIIVTVYVFEVESCAVTFTVTVFEPSARLILPEGVPELTAVPFTVTEAPELEAVAVTVVELSEFATVEVYAVRDGENVSFRLPALIFRSDKLLSLETMLKRALNFIPFFEKQPETEIRTADRNSIRNITYYLTENSDFSSRNLTQNRRICFIWRQKNRF